MICNKWWSKAITILVHEFVHAYDEITKFPTTNDVSAEVIAYSVTYCVALSNATPDKVFPVWEIGKNNFQFEQVYAGFISGKLMESGSAWAAKVPTLLGNNLALLQFFHLFNDAFPQEPTQTELNDVAKYCKYVISQSHDYLKTSYFNRQKTEPTFIKNLRSGIYIPVTIIK